MVKLKSRRAVSNILAALMLVVLGITAAGVGVAYMSKQTETMTKVTRMEMGESRLYVNPVTDEGALTLVLTNTGTTSIIVRLVKIGLQGLANVTFQAQAQITYKTEAGPETVVAYQVTVSDPKESGVTSQGLVLAAQTSATAKFVGLTGFGAFIPPNAEYPVTVYTTGADTFAFKVVAETSA
jgi:hypothetical protein